MTAVEQSTLPPAVILAGGLSRRMGTDKTSVLLGGRTLLAHVAARLRPQVASLALNAPPDLFEARGREEALATDLPLVPDTLAGRPGPLAGILAALRHARATAPFASHVLVAPVDSPFLPNDLVARLHAALTGAETIAVAHSLGAMHPVCGLWPVVLADDLESFLAEPDNRRVKAFLARHSTAAVDFPPITTAAGLLDPFLNVNTPGDLTQAHLFLETRS
ncbi:molybdenum cofactor guanylyltransferase MobA [Rhizobium sp. SAFR-030]|uniref:molybdenum cofactor guanylyltransferase MobA n=1 Tax=Rhizobium sp. SAFR-030 TaxID=3387277 RepID=UPI003F8144B1